MPLNMPSHVMEVNGQQTAAMDGNAHVHTAKENPMKTHLMSICSIVAVWDAVAAESSERKKRCQGRMFICRKKRHVSET